VVSQFAIDEIEQMEAEGLHPTPRDIVRLNALGLKVECGQSHAPLYFDRRCVWIGNVCIMEPTIGVSLFAAQYSDVFGADSRVADTCLKAWAFHFKEPPADMPPKDVADAVSKFITTHFSDIPVKRLIAAVDYCMYGCDSRSFERPARKNAGDAEGERTADDAAEDEAFNIDIGIVHEAEAMGLGITLADARRHTRAQLNAIMERAIESRAALTIGGGDLEKSQKDRYTGEFYATLDEIRARLTAERAAAAK